MEDRETVTISPCPLCSGTHRYEVELHLVSTMKMPRPGICLSPQPVLLTETFTCPEREEPFEHEFQIRLPVGCVVAGVEVV